MQITDESHKTVVLNGLRKLKKVAYLQIEANLTCITYMTLIMFGLLFMTRFRQRITDSELAFFSLVTMMISIALPILFFASVYRELLHSLSSFISWRPEEFSVVLRLLKMEKSPSIVGILIVFIIGMVGIMLGDGTAIIFLSMGFATLVIYSLMCSTGIIIYLLRLREVFNSMLFQIAGSLMIVPLCTLLVPGLFSLVAFAFGLYASVYSMFNVFISMLSFFALNLIVWIIVFVEIESLEEKIDLGKVQV